jgi:uncharacterized membrane protein YeaQ/YmgE (transglycosylase-associated protein family)
MKLDPAATFVIVLIIGILAGLIFDRFAGPGWLKRQISGAAPGMVTSALVGVAGAFVGSGLADVLKLTGYAALIAAVVGAAVVLFAWRVVK